MFCRKCGAEIMEDSAFCSKCGATVQQSQAVVSKKEKTALSTNDYDRQALRIYLGDLRALEYAKSHLQNESKRAAGMINSLGYYNDIKAPDTSGFGYLFLPLGLGVGAWLFGKLISIPWRWVLGFLHISRGRYFFSNLGIILLILGIGYTIYCLIEEIVGTKRDKQRYESERAEDKKRVERELVEKEQWRKRKEKIDTEYNQAAALLKQGYAVNIIPNQFRNLYAIYYIYDYINTSNETLSDAFMHCDLDEIKQKLDRVISNQEQIILNQAIQMAQNDQIMEQNKKHMKQLVSHFERVEQNQVVATQYAQIAANNSEVCKWIAVADYLNI